MPCVHSAGGAASSLSSSADVPERRAASSGNMPFPSGRSGFAPDASIMRTCVFRLPRPHGRAPRRRRRAVRPRPGPPRSVGPPSNGWRPVSARGLGHDASASAPGLNDEFHVRGAVPVVHSLFEQFVRRRLSLQPCRGAQMPPRLSPALAAQRGPDVAQNGQSGRGFPDFPRQGDVVPQGGEQQPDGKHGRAVVVIPRVGGKPRGAEPDGGVRRPFPQVFVAFQQCRAQNVARDVPCRPFGEEYPRKLVGIGPEARNGQDPQHERGGLRPQAFEQRGPASRLRVPLWQADSSDAFPAVPFFCSTGKGAARFRPSRRHVRHSVPFANSFERKGERET